MHKACPEALMDVKNVAVGYMNSGKDENRTIMKHIKQDLSSATDMIIITMDV
jgi:hypothetical protein